MCVCSQYVFCVCMCISNYVLVTLCMMFFETLWFVVSVCGLKVKKKKHINYNSNNNTGKILRTLLNTSSMKDGIIIGIILSFSQHNTIDTELMTGKLRNR